MSRRSFRGVRRGGSTSRVPETARGQAGPSERDRSWPNFTAAADEALLAPIWAGIHFRFAMLDTREIAEQIAAYVLEHAAQPLHDPDFGQSTK